MLSTIPLGTRGKALKLFANYLDGIGSVFSELRIWRAVPQGSYLALCCEKLPLAVKQHTEKQYTNDRLQQ